MAWMFSGMFALAIDVKKVASVDAMRVASDVFLYLHCVASLIKMSSESTGIPGAFPLLRWVMHLIISCGVNIFFWF